MIPNSIVSPSEPAFEEERFELFKTSSRSMLWLTVREGRKFILKGLPEEIRAHPEEIARLRKEYSLGLRINHPGIAGTYGFETHPQVGSVIVMEYVDGITLDKFLSQNGKIPLKIRSGIACEIAETLAYMHSLGISHRDLKPDNILITPRNEAKIIDIGLGDSEDFVLYKQSLATEEFGAPEQQEPSMANTRADVYSFGKLLEILLPESRYRKLKHQCLQNESEKRLLMKDVAEILRKSEAQGSFFHRFAPAISLSVALIVILIGILFLTRPRQTPENSLQDDVKNYDNVEVKTGEPEIKNENIPSEIPLKPSTIQNSAGLKENVEKSRDNVIKKEENIPDVDYERICVKYIAEAKEILKKYGCAYDAEKGLYVDSILSPRSLAMSDIMSRMATELEIKECPYVEMNRLSNLLYDEIMKLYPEIDGREMKYIPQIDGPTMK